MILDALCTLAQSATSGGSGGYRPFLDPLDLHLTWWVTLIPLAFFISFAYKAVRLEDVSTVPFLKHVIVMTVQIVAAMIALAVASYILILKVMPLF